MLESATEWLQQADPGAVYAFLFIVAFLENVVPPIPGDAPVAFVGYLIPYSRISFIGAVVASSLGSLVGFMGVFMLSRVLGVRLYADSAGAARHWFSRSVHRLFPPADMVSLRKKFTTHGYLAVLVNRFLFGSRAVISVMAGLMHLNPLGVLGAAAVSATLWNVLLLGGGHLLGSRWEEIGSYMALYSVPMTILALLLVAIPLRRYLRVRMGRKD